MSQLTIQAPTNPLAASCLDKIVPAQQDGTVYFVPAAGLYSLEFRQLPSPEELSAYAMYRSICAAQLAKSIKNSSVASRTAKKGHLSMADRWKYLSTATKCRCDGMRGKASVGKTMAVYF